MMKRENHGRLAWWVIVGVICCASVLAGCSGSDSNDLISDFFSDISLSVNTLNFTANVNAYQVQTFTITNLGTTNMTIDRITSTNAAFRIGGYFTDEKLIELETPIVIEGKGARAVYIGFYPTEAKTYTGKVVVESTNANDAAETDLISLSGVGVAQTN